MERPIVGIWSGANPLAVATVEKLLANFCSVIVFTEEKKEWLEKTVNIKNHSYLLITKEEDSERRLDYVIVFNLSKIRNLGDKIGEARFLEERYRAKTLLILNYREINGVYRRYKIPEGLGIIYVGDLFGPRMNLKEDYPLARTIRSILKRKSIEVSESEIIYPTPISSLARLISRWLLSFGPYGSEVLVLGNELSTLDFAKIIERVVLNARFAESKQKEKPPSAQIRKYLLKVNLERELIETLDWFVNFGDRNVKITYDLRIPSFPIRAPSLTLRRTAALLVFLFISPLLILLSSLLFLGLTKKAIASNNFSLARSLISTSRGLSFFSEKEASLFSKIPLIDRAYDLVIYFSSVTFQAGEIGEEGISLIKTSKEFLTKILGKDTYDPETYSSQLRLTLDSIYKKASFLKGDIDAGGGRRKQIVLYFLKGIDISEIQNILFQSEALARNLPETLGAGSKKTYLLLFQNNMELRPTGGFIGSFALVSFEGGRLVDTSVSDVYSADGQLKGHVDPPEPIRKYLGEGGWYLRDSNWDPDFPTSASRTEWFLDKETDQSVDGVVGIDLEVARRLLKELGPVSLPDFKTTVDDKNLYAKTQAEVQEKFFPGSRKKASFLTALSTQLMGEISNSQGKNYLGIAKSVFNSLTERHIQVFLHNGEAQDGVANLGWDGGVRTPTCVGNCFPDWLGIVEANLGVNKANYFIERNASLKVSADANDIQHELSINIANSGNRELGTSAIYKVYLRVLAPIDSNFGNVGVYGRDGNKAVSPDVVSVHGRKEAGVYLEVSPKETKKIVFVWNNTNPISLTEKGEYLLYIRKQAGTGNDNVSVNISLPLTGRGIVSYNTNLARDFLANIFW